MDIYNNKCLVFYKEIKMKVNFIKVVALSTLLVLPLAASITQIVTEKAPKAIGPYSQAIRAGEYVYISGQIAIDPSMGKLAGDTIEVQTLQVLKNIEAILEAQGLTLESVVKTEVYLKDLKDFSAMNALYAEKFIFEVKPARATVQVSKLPMDALVEISCVAYVPHE